MELVLNLVWAVLAVAIVRLWLNHAPIEAADRRTGWAALFLLLLILFPVISVTDDLQAMQNPAEAETALRKVQSAVNPYTICPATAALPESVVAAVDLVVLPIAIATHPPLSASDDPALAPIQIRPPPVASLPVFV